MNLTSELSIFAYKEPKESEWKEGRRGASKGGGARRKRGGWFEGAAENEDELCNWKSFGLTILQDSAKMFGKRGLPEQ